MPGCFAQLPPVLISAFCLNPWFLSPFSVNIQVIFLYFLSSPPWDEGKANKTHHMSTQLAVKLCQWVICKVTCRGKTQKGLSLKKKTTRKKTRQWGLMCSSAAKSRAYVAKDT